MGIGSVLFSLFNWMVFRAVQRLSGKTQDRTMLAWTALITLAVLMSIPFYEYWAHIYTEGLGSWNL